MKNLKANHEDSNNYNANLDLFVKVSKPTSLEIDLYTYICTEVDGFKFTPKDEISKKLPIAITSQINKLSNKPLINDSLIMELSDFNDRLHLVASTKTFIKRYNKVVKTLTDFRNAWNQDSMYRFPALKELAYNQLINNGAK